jgi:hypothetical protein
LNIARFFQFLGFYTVGMTVEGDEPVARPLPAYRTTQTQNNRTQTSMPRVGFEPATPVFGREHTVHVLDCEATVIRLDFNTRSQNLTKMQ